MIRLIIVLLGIIILWVWFFSPLSKRPKIVLTSVSMVLAACLAIFESYSHKPRENLIDVAQISICGLSVSHVYRSDFRVNICLQNLAVKSELKRVSFSVSANKCDDQNQCSALETVVRDIPIGIEPEQKLDLMETLRFEQIPADAQGISWSAEVVEVKAVPWR